MAQNPVISHLDPGQIIKRVYEEADDRLRVDAEITANISGAQEVVISHIDDSIRLGDGVDLVTTTTVGPDVGLDVNLIGGVVSGHFTQTGLQTAGKVTTMLITDIATTLPAVAFTGRNTLSLTNESGADTLYIGFSNSVTADSVVGFTSGWEIRPNEGFSLDITDSIFIYGIAATGKSIKVKIMELA